MTKKSAQTRAWEARNPQRFVEIRKKHKLVYRPRVRARNKAIVDSLKSGPCTDCKMTYPPYVMDFDHVKGEKVFNISKVKSISVTQLLTELEKCELVCSNCHRKRTFSRKDFLRPQSAPNRLLVRNRAYSEG